MLVPDEEIVRRREALTASGGYKYPPSQTPWQEIQRGMVDQLGQGMVLKPRIAMALVPSQGSQVRAVMAALDDMLRAAADDPARVIMVAPMPNGSDLAQFAPSAPKRFSAASSATFESVSDFEATRGG